MNEILINNPFRVGHKNFKFKILNFKLLNPVRGVMIVEKERNISFKPRRGDIIRSTSFPKHIQFRVGRWHACDNNPFSSSADYNPFRVGHPPWRTCDHDKKIPSSEGYGFSRGRGHTNFKFQISNFKFFKPRRGIMIKNPLPGGVAAEGRRGGFHPILKTLNSKLYTLKT
jgi:hypothetical protein